MRFLNELIDQRSAPGVSSGWAVLDGLAQPPSARLPRPRDLLAVLSTAAERPIFRPDVLSAVMANPEPMPRHEGAADDLEALIGAFGAAGAVVEFKPGVSLEIREPEGKVELSAQGREDTAPEQAAQPTWSLEDLPKPKREITPIPATETPHMIRWRQTIHRIVREGSPIVWSARHP